MLFRREWRKRENYEGTRWSGMDSNLVTIRLEYKPSVMYQVALAMIGAHAQGFGSLADSLPYVPTGTHSHLKFESSGMWRCVSEHIVLDVSADCSASIFRLNHEIKTLLSFETSGITHTATQITSQKILIFRKASVRSRLLHSVVPAVVCRVKLLFISAYLWCFGASIIFFFVGRPSSYRTPD
jgi:hypothetical protein